MVVSSPDASVAVLLGVVMRDRRRADACQNGMAVEDAVMAAFGQGIGSDPGACRREVRMAMEPTAAVRRGGCRMSVEKLSLGRHGERDRQGESAGESEGDTAFARSIVI